MEKIMGETSIVPISLEPSEVHVVYILSSPFSIGNEQVASGPLAKGWGEGMSPIYGGEDFQTLLEWTLPETCLSLLSGD